MKTTGFETLSAVSGTLSKDLNTLQETSRKVTPSLTKKGANALKRLLGEVFSPQVQVKVPPTLSDTDIMVLYIISLFRTVAMLSLASSSMQAYGSNGIWKKHSGYLLCHLYQAVGGSPSLTVSSSTMWQTKS